MTEPSLNPNIWNMSYREYLIRFALMRVSDYGTAEDLVQDTFLSGWNGRRHFRGDCSERTWLTGILRNKIIDHYRKTGRRPAILATDLESSSHRENEYRSWIDEQPDERATHRPGAGTERREFMEELELAVSRLPGKMGAAFRMREMLGYSTNEITRDLKISKANLWVLIHRAKQVLSSELSENWEGVESFGGRAAA
jgi:RNA polymerase sigma-70 factor (TIGR02943 family)